MTPRPPSAEAWNTAVTRMSLDQAARILGADRSERSLDVAGQVFRSASQHDERFTNPTPLLIYSWAEIFDCDNTRCMGWLTPHLAHQAVNSFFQRHPDGILMPATVIAYASQAR